MPNTYHYFESGEVSYERLSLEIEILKQLQKANLLHNIHWNWNKDAKNELTHRHNHRRKNVKQLNFIKQFIHQYRQSSSINEHIGKKKTLLPLIFNIGFLIVCLLFIIGLFVYEYIQFNHQHHLLKTLDYPLTAKRRQLSFTDDLFIILLTFTSCIILTCIIIATRFNRYIILFGFFTLIILIILLIAKVSYVVTFLSKYREIRWPDLYDYLHS
ncbi:hypothetical protein I4U23_013720 [Adineta vaga]|nr:hypothetical protein I4U23_013720 [Adineta vaga]